MEKIKIDKADNISISNISENDIGTNKVSVKQNSSGFWYVNDITVNCIDIIVGIETIEGAIHKINDILKVLNGKGKK